MVVNWKLALVGLWGSAIRLRPEVLHRESGGEGSAQAKGKSICMRYLPAAETIRHAGFLLANVIGESLCSRLHHSGMRGRQTYATVCHGTDWRGNLRRAGQFRRTRAGIFH